MNGEYLTKAETEKILDNSIPYHFNDDIFAEIEKQIKQIFCN